MEKTLNQREHTIALIKSRRSFGAVSRRRRMPRQTPPDAIVRDYRAFVKRSLDIVGDEFAELLADLPGIIARNIEALRHDDDDAEKVRRAIAEARRRIREKVAGANIEAQVNEYARRISSYQMLQLQNQIKAGIGIDLLVSDKAINAMVRGFVAGNVSLISDVTDSTAAKYETTIMRGLTTGMRHEEVARDLQKALGIGESRAALIARDQVLTLYSQVNNSRQKSIGLTEYVWRTVHDERVRDSHAANDGKAFQWSDPPDETGHPGEDINCRCYAEPVFAGLLD